MRKAFRIGLNQNTKHHLSVKKIHILAPLRRPLSDFSKAAFVSSLKTDVRVPAAAKPARKDCRT